MQDTNLKTQIDLSKFYSPNNLSDLYQVFPKLKQNSTHSTKLNSPGGKIIIDKFSFYQMVLEKLKNYFEINESFIISKSISIILNDLKSLIDNKSSVENKYLPLITKNRFAYERMSHSKEITHLKRNLTSKSNGKNKIYDQKRIKAYNTFFDLDQDKNICDINNVYINMDKNKKSNVKIVHFFNKSPDDKKDSKQNTSKKKSNLKKTKSKRDISLTNDFIELNNSNMNPLTSKSRKISFNKPKTENSIRNKSNGTKFKEKNHNVDTDTNKIEIKTKIIYDNKILTDSSNDINDKNFDIFKFSKKVGKDKVLPHVGNYIFTKYNFKEFIDITKFRNWCEKITNGYINTNYYHNSLHGADITHTCYMYFIEGSINDNIGLNNKSICALFLSCICHDFKHPGINNNFLIETKNHLSLTYNDISVLENMHISEAFNLINSDPNCNMFEKFDNSEYKIFRKQMISCVLATDMANHKDSLNFIQKCLKDGYTKTEEDNQNYMNLLIHSADISNPTKKFDVYFQWAKLVVEEFYYQGDKEKELGLKCSCDRNLVTIYKSQLGFIDFIITPFYKDFVKIFPKLNYLYDNVEENRKKIKMLEDEDNKNKK